jgi:hypothetical protein
MFTIDIGLTVRNILSFITSITSVQFSGTSSIEPPIVKFYMKKEIKVVYIHVINILVLIATVGK